MLYRTVALCIVSWLAIGLWAVTSCDRFGRGKQTTVVEEKTSVAPGCLATGKHCTSVDLVFAGAKSTGRTDDVARLGFTVDSDLDAPQQMSIVDPDRPKGVTARLDCCALKFEPRLGEANVTSQNGKECWAPTWYDFSLVSVQDAPIADFEISDSGILSVVTGSVRKPYDVQIISTRGRSIYMVFKVAEITAKAEPLFAFEWQKQEGYDRHSLKAADGWSYEFRGHDGKLGFFHASCLGTLPDDLQMIALEEQGDRAAELKAWVASNAGCAPSG